VNKIEILPFQKKHLNDCLSIFESNCPPFFDPSEKILFTRFLDSLITDKPIRKSIQKNFFFVAVAIKTNDVVGCGGYYSVKGAKQIRFSWGMVLNSWHGKRIGTQLVDYRIDKIRRNFQGFDINLDTSQHTFEFYMKNKFSVLSIEKEGYSKDLDKYELKYTR